MGIGGHLSFVSLSIGGTPIINIHPPLFVLTELAFGAFATKTHDMAAFVASYFLAMDLLSADPAAEFFLFFLDF
jgi:hypothetical protein